MPKATSQIPFQPGIHGMQCNLGPSQIPQDQNEPLPGSQCQISRDNIRGPDLFGFSWPSWSVCIPFQCLAHHVRQSVSLWDDLNTWLHIWAESIFLAPVLLCKLCRQKRIPPQWLYGLHQFTRRKHALLSLSRQSHTITQLFYNHSGTSLIIKLTCFIK